MNETGTTRREPVSPLQQPLNVTSKGDRREHGRGAHVAPLPVLLALMVSSLSARVEAAEPRQTSVAAASSTLNELGVENGVLATQAGLWSVTETIWATPDAKPVVITGLVAERRMVGNLLEEALYSESDPKVLRRDFLTFNRVEGRFEYMSFDTRAAVGMMTAQSYGSEEDGTIRMVFQPFAMPGGGLKRDGSSPVGQMVRMRQDFVRQDANHILKNQYFAVADGSGVTWLAHRYDLVRRK